MERKEIGRFAGTLLLFSSLTNPVVAQDFIDWSGYSQLSSDQERQAMIMEWMSSGTILPKGKQFYYATLEDLDDDVLGSFLPIDETIIDIQNFETCSGSKTLRIPKQPMTHVIIAPEFGIILWWSRAQVACMMPIII